KTYTILSATGGRSGTFGTFTTSGLPGGFTASLTYTATDAVLNLMAILGQPSQPSTQSVTGFNQNQQNVATSLNSFFNNGGALPPNFVTVFGLTGGNLGTALSQLSGEPATGAQQSSFKLMDMFLNLMLDPFVDGRGSGDGPALGFAPGTQSTLPP